MASYRRGKTLQLGPLTLSDPIYVELELAFLAPAFGVEIAGIVGFEVFSRAILALDLESTTLAIYDPETFDLGEDAWTPLVLDRRIPSLRCRFEGDREGLFKLDLGDNGTVTFYTPAVESLKLLDGRQVSPSQVGGVGGSGKASAGNLEWFEIGGQRIEPLWATFSQTEVGVFSSSQALGNLGTKMLDPFLVVLDYPSSRLALLPRE